MPETLLLLPGPPTARHQTVVDRWSVLGYLPLHAAVPRWVNPREISHAYAIQVACVSLVLSSEEFVMNKQSFLDNGALGRGLTIFKHNLNDSGMFSDAKLAELIERFPHELRTIKTMTVLDGHPNWMNGSAEGLSGQQIIEAIRHGSLWLNLRRFDAAAPDYDALIKEAFDEAVARVPALKTFKYKSGLLISSPNSEVIYHVDVPMQLLWHVRGSKRIYIYDHENRTNLPNEVMEDVAIGAREENIPYDPAWDKDALIFDLDEGDAISWPHHAPHRIETGDDLNVSVTTEYFTMEALLRHGVFYQNAINRRRLGFRQPATSITGLGALAKCGISLALKKLNARLVQPNRMMGEFVLDKNRLGAIQLVPKEDQEPLGVRQS
jgi:hypothetical protein